MTALRYLIIVPVVAFAMTFLFLSGLLLAVRAPFVMLKECLNGTFVSKPLGLYFKFYRMT